MREHNLGLVLRRVADAPAPVSRADIALVTGLTRATVSSLVDALLEGGLLVELEPRSGPQGGRPAAGLVLSDRGPAGLGLEVNVDYVAACVRDLRGAVRHRAVRRGDLRGRRPAQALRALLREAHAALDAAGNQGLVVAGATVAVPGVVDAADGVLRTAPNLRWRDVDVRDLLRRDARLAALDLTVGNEANLAAVGELDARPEGPDGFVLVSGEIGVGAGIVVGGRPFRGGRGWSGEIGHVPVEPDGARCSCGARGCLETVAGQEALLRSAGLDVPASSSLGGEGSVRLLVDAAQADDPRALAALTAAGRAIGLAASAAVNLLDVQAVILGGIYAPLAPWLTGPVGDELTERVVTSAWAPVDVLVSRAGTDAAVLGGARTVLDGVLADPASWLRRAGVA
jgi:predicted NBD/HSP70 family sugar kinase